MVVEAETETPALAAVIAAPPDLVPTPSPSLDAFRLDPERSGLYVLVRHDPTSLGAGLASSDHLVAATRWRGLASFDPDDPGRCHIDVEVPVDGLEVDPPDARARAGLLPVAGVNLRRIVEVMRSPRQLDAGAFPTISFRSTGCERTVGEDGFLVTGELTAHGMVAPVEAALAIRADDYTIRAVGSFAVTHAALGMEPYASGMLRNVEPLEFTLDVTGERPAFTARR